MTEPTRPGVTPRRPPNRRQWRALVRTAVDVLINRHSTKGAA